MLIPHLPHNIQTWTLTPTVELRYRIERRNDKDFYAPTNDNRTDSLARVRIGVAGKNEAGWKFLIQYQYGIDDYWVRDLRTTVRNSDMQFGYVQAPIKNGSVTLGRQGLVVGTGRLISSMSVWGNVGRTFDGVRVKTGPWDLWAMREGAYSYYNPRTRIVGASRSTGRGLSSVFYKHDGRDSSAEDVWTGNQIWKQPLGKVNVLAELDGQMGRRLGQDVSAWAGTLNVSKNAKRFTPYAELDVASGGTSGSTTHTFDPLYPNDPAIYGMRQMQGFQNVVETKIGMTYAAGKADCLTAYVSDLNLYSKTDAWYGAYGVNKGKVTFKDPTGDSGKHIGNMAQIDFQHTIGSHELIWLGVGYFRPGSFIEHLNGQTNNQTWLSASYCYKY